MTGVQTCALRISFVLSRSFRKHRQNFHPPESDVLSANETQLESHSYLMGPLSIGELSDGDDEVSAGDCNGSVPSALQEQWNDDFVNIFTGLLSNDVMKCVAYLYSIPNLPRNCVLKIIETMNILLNGESFSKLDEIILSRLGELGESDKDISRFPNLLERRKNPFEGFDTEHLIKRKFVQRGSFIESKSIVIGQRSVYKKNKKGATQAKQVPLHAEFVPMRVVLKKFFELPSVFSRTVSYIKTLESEKETGMVRNIIQGELWQSLNVGPFDESHPTLPCGVFYDDYENNNPLGSHSGMYGKCGAVYFTIPILPIEMASKVDNLFIFQIFRTMDKNSCTINEIFNEVVNELNFLEKEGIKVSVAGKEITIKFKLCVVPGDNLGLHFVHGLYESFSAKYPCLTCFTPKTDFCRIFIQDDATLRTKEHFEELYDNLRAKLEPSYGIKQESIFNEVGNYHVGHNRSADKMHDLEEGVCRYDVGKVLSHFITGGHFTLAFLNERIAGFGFGVNEQKNKSRPILESHIKRRMIIMSASEMKCFIQTLPLIIGDQIAEGDPIWELFLKLKHLMEIVNLRAVHKMTHIYLKTIVSEYLETLVELFPRDNIKPKHHHLVHYPLVMKLMGPLPAISSIRGESKHQVSKRYSAVCRSRVNLPRSLVTKNQFCLNYRFLKEEMDGENAREPNFICGPQILGSKDQVKHISFLGMDINVGSVVVLLGKSGQKFYLVKEIMLESSSFSIIEEKLYVEYFDHYDSYRIISQSFIPKQKKILQTDLLCPSSNVTFIVRLNSHNFICKKWP